jgi:uncharacterized membrane protein (Fun14 family)
MNLWKKGQPVPNRLQVNYILSEAFSVIIFQLGIGGIGGFFIGYAVRKVLKIALILGIFVFSLLFLVYAKVIGINYGGLANALSSFFGTVNPVLGSLGPLLLNLPLIGSLIIGLIAGYKMG